MSELEKAAEEYSQYGMGQSGFIAGAKWQSNQSPWHNVSEGLAILTRTNMSANFVLTDVSKQELEKRRIPVYSYLL